MIILPNVGTVLMALNIYSKTDGDGANSYIDWLENHFKNLEDEWHDMTIDCCAMVPGQKPHQNC